MIVKVSYIVSKWEGFGGYWEDCLNIFNDVLIGGFWICGVVFY